MAILKKSNHDECVKLQSGIQYIPDHSKTLVSYLIVNKNPIVTPQIYAISDNPSPKAQNHSAEPYCSIVFSKNYRLGIQVLDDIQIRSSVNPKYIIIHLRDDSFIIGSNNQQINT